MSDDVGKLLIAKDDINVDSTDNRKGRTPLSRAAENGHEAGQDVARERQTQCRLLCSLPFNDTTVMQLEMGTRL